MFKYAFIHTAEGGSPETYYATYANRESVTKLIGVDNFDMAKEIAAQLDAEGYDLIDTCGDFTDEILEQFRAVTPNGIRLTHADYLPAELEKIENLESLYEYGIIAVTRGVKETVKIEAQNESCHTQMCLVAREIEAAKEAAVKLVEEGIAFIELCSWFDKEKTQAIIDAIGGKVPVGSCGDLK